jgi:hypothetical protein
MKEKWVGVNDRMQRNYRYRLSAPAGRSLAARYEKARRGELIVAALSAI